MSEMIERVATAIYAADGWPGEDFASENSVTQAAFRKRAIAAIRAMRIPNKRMIKARQGFELGDDINSYAAMIDAALTE